MELFTREYRITQTNPDDDEVLEYGMTVTNDRNDIVDGEYVAVAYTSPRTGTVVEELYEYGEEPKDLTELAMLVALHEKVEPCYIDIDE